MRKYETHLEASASEIAPFPRPKRRDSGTAHGGHILIRSLDS